MLFLLLVANFVFRMNISLSSTDSARLPDYPMLSPDNRQQLTVEPLSTKRERVSTLKFKNSGQVMISHTSLISSW